MPSGTSGADVFRFDEGTGQGIHGSNSRTIVNRFDASQDTIDLTGFEQNIHWNDLKNCIAVSHERFDDGTPWTHMTVDLRQWGGGTLDVRMYGTVDSAEENLARLFVLDLQGTDGHDNLWGGDPDEVMYGGAGVDDIKGYAGNDTLYGGADNDLIGGGAGDDRIIGGTGNDQLHGGTGDDVFVYASGDGDDAIWDFRPSRGDNKIDLTGVTGVSQYSDLNVTQRPGAVVITFPGQEGSITLQNFKIDDLDESDFIFAGAADADGM
ncbi:MAG: hypothetical protein OXH69_12770 [Acidobacteria bacterium]|nr:hypothetical protein [Acidobacteriota bacterium]